MASFLESAIEIAHEAGSLLQHYFERHVRFRAEGRIRSGDGGRPGIGEADRRRLSALYPDHAIVAEEGGGHESASEYRWYVDPLDGTTNFAHGYPVYNVTLALEKAGELIAGVIFDPTRNEMFTCEKGAGAFLNGRRIHVSRADKTERISVQHRLPEPPQAS